ncbi:MAG TPA: hypothetical protein VD908_08315 [Cytophagales bacterium]|nr:hypothetical protein [Cytophagales bacterium]
MEKLIQPIEGNNIFKTGDAVHYRDGMDFKNFNGIVEHPIYYKGGWQYLVKDIKDNSVKRVGEKYLGLNIEVLPTTKGKNRFKAGDSVKYSNEKDFQVFTGIIERSINNYKGAWEYFIKDTKENTIKRVEEKHLQLAI